MARASYIYSVTHEPTEKVRAFTVKWEAVEYIQKSGLDPDGFRCTRFRDGKDTDPEQLRLV